jgi:hypothetical protein
LKENSPALFEGSYKCGGVDVMNILYFYRQNSKCEGKEQKIFLDPKLLKIDWRYQRKINSSRPLK